MGKRGPQVEVKKVYSDYEYTRLTFEGDNEALKELANIRPDRRTALLDKWYQAWRDQNASTNQ